MALNVCSFRFIALFLTLSSEFRPSSACLSKIDKERKVYIINDPLYTGDSILELLSICKMFPNPYPITVSTDEIDHLKPTDCPHDVIRDRKYTNIELFYLKQAQKQIESQGKYMKSKLRGLIIVLFFVIALFMTIYLIVVGHFDYRMLPFMNHFFNVKRSKDKTSGLIYSQSKFKKFSLKPKSHWSFKGVDTSKLVWFKYLRRDHKLYEKSEVSFKKFKFMSRAQITKNFGGEDDEHSKRKLFSKGWEFLLMDKQMKDNIIQEGGGQQVEDAHQNGDGQGVQESLSHSRTVGFSLVAEK